MTHFEVFGLPPRYDVELGWLEQQYREQSLRLHPDRHSGGDARERRLALERTTALNEAFKVLKDPVKRATYLLKLHGVDLDREDAGAQKGMPHEFLEEILALREELEEARERKDLTSAQKMATEVQQRRTAALEQAAGALRTLEGGTATPDVLALASHQLARVRYFARFLEEVEAFEEQALEEEARS